MPTVSPDLIDYFDGSPEDLEKLFSSPINLERAYGYYSPTSPRTKASNLRTVSRWNKQFQKEKETDRAKRIKRAMRSLAAREKAIQKAGPFNRVVAGIKRLAKGNRRRTKRRSTKHRRTKRRSTKHRSTKHRRA